LFDFHLLTREQTVVDIGAGFGWLAMAFALKSDARIIAIEPDEERLMAGREIAQVMGIARKIEWRPGLLGNLPLENQEADVVYCIEVLEHVQRSKGALMDLCRITKDKLILTTPNKWFPLIAHDTELPFCHWLPVFLRNVYAKACNRSHMENDNLFWSPYTLKKNMKDFKRISRWLHYSYLQRYFDTYPFFLPYKQGSYVEDISQAKKWYYKFAASFGRYSYLLAPNLAGVFQRKC